MGREHTKSSPWVHRGNPAFPHAMVLTVSFVISPVIGFLVTVALLLHKLDASVEASGPHDFTVRNQRRSSARAVASNASRPASVTIAIRPSVGQDGATYEVICFGEERKYFHKRGWTGHSVICPSG